MGMQLGCGKSVKGARLHCDEPSGQKAVVVRNGATLTLTRCLVVEKRVSNLSSTSSTMLLVSSAKAYMNGLANSVNAGCKPSEISLP